MLLLPPLSSHMSAARKLTPHTVLEVSGHILNIWNICMKYHCLVWFECKVCYQIKLKPHAVLAVKVVIYWLEIFWRNILVFCMYVYQSYQIMPTSQTVAESGHSFVILLESGDAYQKWLLFLLWIQYNSPEILKVFFDQILHQWLIFMNFFANFGKHIPPLQQRICLWSAGVDIKRAAADNRHISLFECKCSKTWPDKK